MKNPTPLLRCLILFTLALLIHFNSYSQDLYTARGYWVESTKETYRKIKQKERVGDPLTDNERSYLQDYEVYLANYYQRLPDSEKALYDQMKSEWDRELFAPQKPTIVQEEFEWRGRDRAINFFYGLGYGASLVVIADIDNAEAVGIALVTGGLWTLGPVLNPKKYEDINRPVLRASNTGKLLGAWYGAWLGQLIGGDSDITDAGHRTFHRGKYCVGRSGVSASEKKELFRGAY